MIVMRGRAPQPRAEKTDQPMTIFVHHLLDALDNRLTVSAYCTERNSSHRFSSCSSPPYRLMRFFSPVYASSEGRRTTTHPLLLVYFLVVARLWRSKNRHASQMPCSIYTTFPNLELLVKSMQRRPGHPNQIGPLW